MTAPLQSALASRFPSVGESDAQVFQAPESVLFGQNAHRSGEQVASRSNRVKATEGGALLDRIRENVAFSPTGCWLWKGARNSKGYGQIGLFANGKSTSKSVHRLVAAIAHGPIPEGLLALHTCDVRHCVNPAHLYVGTLLDNARDCKARGRGVNTLALINAAKTHCLRGHPYSLENTRVNKKNGGRLCRICQAVSSRRHAAKRAAEKLAERAA